EWYGPDRAGSSLGRRASAGRGPPRLPRRSAPDHHSGAAACRRGGCEAGCGRTTCLRPDRAMITHIDVSHVLRHRVCELYADLVTRTTGAAVRTAIEQQLASSGTRTLIVIDFTHVGLLDFSCADEVV